MDKKKNINQYGIEIEKLSDLPEDDFLKLPDENNVIVTEAPEHKSISS